MKNPFGPLITAMVTPFNSKGEVDLDKSVEIAGKLVNDGSDGIVLTGTTGESPTLEKSEKLELYRTLVQKIDNVDIIAGTGSYCTRQSMELTREAEKVGVNGIMLVTPYYNKPSQEGLYRHFKKIADSTSLPVILYNVPGRTGVNLNPETVARLSEVDNIIALKDAGKDLEQTAAVCRRVAPGFAVYSGDDSTTLPVLSVGGYGVISVASHLLGLEIKAVIELYRQGRNQEASAKFHYLLPLFKGMFISPNPAPVKEALNLMGYNVGGCRLPLIEMAEDARRELREILNMYRLATS